MTKFVSSLIVCGALSVSSLSATELNHEQYEQDVAPSVLFGYETQKLDLISIASNGALTEQSEGVYVLSALEMQEVQGGSLKKFWKRYKKNIGYGIASGVATAITCGAAGTVMLNTAMGGINKTVSTSWKL
ncbi:MAG: hypothetical protein K2N69_07540 [Helicobacter sp.]|nr:hypothetical protein [Helicobacter sp.]